MSEENNWVVLGRFGRTHGTKGFIVLHSFTDPKTNILSYKNWHGYFKKCWQPLKLAENKAHAKHIIVKIDGYLTREQIAQLTNVPIGIQASELPALAGTEYYWRQLIGMTVINQHEVILGKVKSIMPTNVNDILIVEGRKRYLIPYLKAQFITTVNLATGIINVIWDEGF